MDDLVALPRPSGHTFLDWSGPTGGGISYEIETRTKADSPWEKLDYTLKTAYTHTDAGAGEVEARRDRLELEGDGRLGDERVEDRRRRRGDRSSDEEVRRQEAPEGDREEDAEGLTAGEIMLDGGMTRV